MADAKVPGQYIVKGTIIPQELGDVLVVKKLQGGDSLSECYKACVFRDMETKKYRSKLRRFHDADLSVIDWVQAVLRPGAGRYGRLVVQIAVVRLSICGNPPGSAVPMEFVENMASSSSLADLSTVSEMINRVITYEDNARFVSHNANLGRARMVLIISKRRQHNNNGEGMVEIGGVSDQVQNDE